MLAFVSQNCFALLAGYAVCVLVPFPWLSQAIIDGWAALGTSVKNGLHSLTAGAAKEAAAAVNAVTAPAVVQLHPATVIALASAVAGQIAANAAPAAVGPAATSTVTP